MMPPTSIDGTDITGATIDGTDVQEITVDGDTVFSASTNPVAYSDLVAWWPFDSSFYGGFNTDDVTATFNSGQSGDSTAYDADEIGSPTYNSSGGSTDINAGASSGFYNVNGDDHLRVQPTQPTIQEPITVTLWARHNSGSADFFNDMFSRFRIAYGFVSSGFEFTIVSGGSFVHTTTGITTSATFVHLAATVASNGDIQFFINGNLEATNTSGGIEQGTQRLDIGETGGTFDGDVDDVRVYDRVLTATEIDTIYQNTD